MKIPVILLVAAATAQSGSALACSLPVREHPLLASQAPFLAEEGNTTVRIAISEILLPARSAKTQDPFQRIWLGLRGQKLVDGTEVVLPEIVEATGQLDVICFVPSDRYKVLSDGRLVVWISGKLQSGSPTKLLLSTAGPQAERVGSVWRAVRWPSDDDDNNAPALPSHRQPGMIHP